MKKVKQKYGTIKETSLQKYSLQEKIPEHIRIEQVRQQEIKK